LRNQLEHEHEEIEKEIERERETTKLVFLNINKEHNKKIK